VPENLRKAVVLEHNDTSSHTPALKAHNVSKQIGGRVIIDSVSLDVQDGEIIGILGQNGVGKTTLLKTLAGVFALDSGTIEVFGIDLLHDPREAKRQLGVVSQSSNLDGDLTVLQNFRYHAKLHRLHEAEWRPNAKELLGSMQLHDVLHKYPRTLSEGTKKKIMIARGLLHKPRLLFIDEPSENLDPLAANSMKETIKQLNSDNRLSVLLTTNRVDEAEGLCNRIAIMFNGRLACFASIPNLLTSMPLIHAVQLEGYPPLSISDSRVLRVFREGKLTHVRTADEHYVEDLRSSPTYKSDEVVPSTLEDVFLWNVKKKG